MKLMTTTYKGNPVHTWADGFGNWHARVDLPDGGEYALGSHWSAIRAAARRAIRAELTERMSARACLAPVRIEVVAHDANMSSSFWHSVTFKERVTA